MQIGNIISSIYDDILLLSYKHLITIKLNTNMSKTTDNKLVTFWKEQNDKADEIKLNEAALEIQIQAESDLHSMYKEVKTAESDLRKAKVNAQWLPDFKTIAFLTLKVKKTVNVLTNALEVYLNLFGEKPKFDFSVA